MTNYKKKIKLILALTILLILPLSAATLTADAGADINHTVTASNTAVHLVGTATDSDDNIVKYEWFNGTTFIGKGASRWYSLTENGEYNLTFKITDADGNVASDSIIVHVNHENTINTGTLTADAGVAEKTHTVTASNRQIHLKGTTTVGNSNIISQEWFKDGIKILNNSSAWYTLVTPGEYSFEFRVTTEDGSVASDVMLVTVINDAIVPPTLTADAGPDINHTVTASHTAVHLVGTATDSDNNIVKYEWFNGTTFIGIGASRWYSLTENGEHNLTFKVTDADGNVATDSMIVKVSNGTVANVLGISQTVGEGCSIANGSLAKNDNLLWQENCSTGNNVYIKNIKIGDSSVRIVREGIPYQHYDFRYLSKDYFIIEELGSFFSQSIERVDGLGERRYFNYAYSSNEIPHLLSSRETNEGFFASYRDYYNNNISCVYYNGETFQNKTMIENIGTPFIEVFDTNCGQNGTFLPEAFNQEVKYTFNIENDVKYVDENEGEQPQGLASSVLVATDTETGEKSNLLTISNTISRNWSLYPELLTDLIYSSDTYYVVTKEGKYDTYTRILSIEFGKFTGENKSKATLSPAFYYYAPIDLKNYAETNKGLYLLISMRIDPNPREECIYFNPITAEVSSEIVGEYDDFGNLINRKNTKCGPDGSFNIL